MKYVAYYTTADDVRVSSPAANTKIEAISLAAADGGQQVKILSPCITAKKNGFIHGRKFSVNGDCRIICTQFPMFGTSVGFLRHIGYWFSNFLLFFRLLFTRKKEPVLFYHAIERVGAVAAAKKIRGFSLALEVEELYADILTLSEKEKKAEKKILDLADAFVFSTESLNRLANPQHKPYVVINGSYESQPVKGEAFQDGKIHCIYAGTFEMAKGGAMAAVQAAAYLPENYHVHILGFGTEQDTQTLLAELGRIQQECRCTLTYDGLKTGEDFLSFLQKCDIGLSTQIPDGRYVRSSFPSKILVYMANGLRVISPRIEAVEQSGVGSSVQYYNEQTSQSIADAIMAVKMNEPYDSRSVLAGLKADFTKGFNALIMSENHHC